MTYLVDVSCGNSFLQYRYQIKEVSEMNKIITFETKDIIVSEHAYQRMKQRAGFNKKAADRMTIKAYYGGKEYKKLKEKYIK